MNFFLVTFGSSFNVKFGNSRIRSVPVFPPHQKTSKNDCSHISRAYITGLTPLDGHSRGKSKSDIWQLDRTRGKLFAPVLQHLDHRCLFEVGMVLHSCCPEIQSQARCGCHPSQTSAHEIFQIE